MRTVARSSGIFSKCGGEKHRIHAGSKVVLPGELSRKFIVCPAAQHKLHFIAGSQSIQIPQVKCISLTRMGTLHIDDFDDLRWHLP